MSLIGRWPIKTLGIVLLVSVPLLAYVFWNSSARNFRIAEIKPVAVVETKPTGEQIVYQTYHASIAGYPAATEADMYTFAEKVFSDQIREMAERDGKSQVWITFYLERVVIDGQEKIRTFQIIYARDGIDGLGWHRLKPKTATTKT